VTTLDGTNEARWYEDRDSAIELFIRLGIPSVARALTGALPGDPTGEHHAEQGLAKFFSEDYPLAHWYYQWALNRNPGNKDWIALRDLASANADAAIDVHVPPEFYFEFDQLLVPPTVSSDELPAPPCPPPPPGLRTRFERIAGEFAGRAASGAVDSITEYLGKNPGYRGDVWTNWYHRHYLVGLFILAYMRGQLNRFNLQNTYPRGSLQGFANLRLNPPNGVTHFRTANGTWNNLCNPKEGAAGTRFLRNVTIGAIKRAREKDPMSPDPRKVSIALLTRENGVQEVPFLNMLATAWINFQNHDWIHHGEPHPADTYVIPLADNDPIRARYGLTNIVVPKTQEDPTYRKGKEDPPVTFINEVTHWWDGSQIYGSDKETSDRLRSHEYGKLRLGCDSTLPRRTLPRDDNDKDKVDDKDKDKVIEDTGFVRNWWVGLSMFHTLFVREHNAICDRLLRAHPDWDDNRLFNVARLINAAVMAKIHTIEWVPAVLPNRIVNEGANANWYGLLTNLFHTGKSRHTKAPVNVRNIEMGGAVGNPIDNHGCPFGLTEEFVEVYRLHSMLPEVIQARRMGDGTMEEIPLPRTRQAGSPKMIDEFGMANLLFSFGNQHAGQLVLNNYPGFMQEISVPRRPVLDMGTLDILRARERGVPRYNAFRRQLRLNPIRSFSDLTDDQTTIAKLEAVYGRGKQGVEMLDLMIGTLAEAPTRRPRGFGFGETLFQIFILNATRRLQADRFYTDSYNEETYTKEGLRWVDMADLKGVLLRHYPELVSSGLSNVKNAFEPWDEGHCLEPERHPLRAFDPELRRDPWLGDKARRRRNCG
jgi:Animal haem peroxidase